MKLFQSFSKRNTSVEVLRLVFMLGIVLLHAYYHGSDGDIEWIYSLGCDNANAYQLSIYSLTRLGVTGFMFISGYYGVNMNKNKVIELLLILAFYYFALAIGSDKSLPSMIILLLHVWDAWWFVAAYFFICILSPIINSGLEKITNLQYKWIIVGLLLYTYCGRFLVAKDDHDVVLLLSIYLIARYLRLKIAPPPSCSILRIIVLISLTVLIVLPIVVMRLTHSVGIVDALICNNSPLILIAAASLVMLFDRMQYHNGFINWMAGSTLSIYLLTENAFRKVLDSWLLDNIKESVIAGYGIVIGVCILCLFADKLRELLFIPIKKHILK